MIKVGKLCMCVKLKERVKGKLNVKGKGET